MKNKYKWSLVIISILLLLIIMYFVISYVRPSDEVLLSCSSLGVEGYCIDVEFKTTTDKEGRDISEFSFPHYLRQGDFLWIDKITIIKKEPIINKNSNDEEKILGSNLKFNIAPSIGHLEIGSRASNYGEFNPPIKKEIKFGDKYEIKKMENGYYYHCFNGEKIFEQRHWRIELYYIGDWHIKFDIKSDDVTGHTTLFNGRWHGDVFYVHPRHEIENARSSERSMKVGIISLLVIIYLFLFDKFLGRWNL